MITIFAQHIGRLPCLSDLHLIDLTLNNCTKIDNGLSCEFLLNVSTNPINYEHYLPVIYDGASVELPRDHILVKAINSDEMGLINCTVTELSIVNFCTFKTWDFAKHLFETDPLLAIENNNFIFIDINEPLQLPNQSVLIMDNDYHIALTSDNDTASNLTNLSPFILSFYKDSSLTISKKKLNYSFKGSLNDNVTITQISIFNLTTIEYMHAKASLLHFWYITWPEVAKYLGIATQVVAAYIVIISCALCAYAIVVVMCYNKEIDEDSNPPSALA